MIFELTCKDPEIKAIFKKRCNIESDTVYVRGASFSEDLINWSKPDFGLAVIVNSALMANTDSDDMPPILKPTSFEDTRPLMDTIFTEGELVSFEDALKELEWKNQKTRVLDKEENPIMMFGIASNQPILAFSKATATGLLFVDNYLIIQDSNNFSTYNMESERKFLPLKGDMFYEYLTLIEDMFSNIKDVKEASEGE